MGCELLLPLVSSLMSKREIDLLLQYYKRIEMLKGADTHQGFLSLM